MAKRKKRGRPAGSSKSASAATKLSLKAGDLNLTVESSDSGLINSLLDQVEFASRVATQAATGVIGAAKKRGPGRPKKAASAKKKPGPKPGAKRGRKPGRPKLSKKVESKSTSPRGRIATPSEAHISTAVGKAKPSNNEQRILLFALAAKLADSKGEFTTSDVKAYAKQLNLTVSSIPGSLSKLKKAKQISTRKEGRVAIYSITAAGEAQAKKLQSGTRIGGRRGRKPGSTNKTKKAAAKPAKKGTGRRGRPRKAASATAKAAAPKKKRGPGRPKKATTAAKKRGPGRPKKATSTAAGKKRGPGRPPKAASAKKKPGPKPGAKRGRKPGRPKKKA